ncbi:MAG: transposase [Algicola sp.]|nr:transposase [Vibrionaceae bacterium]MBR9915856.1 transposase [Algicola sp.]
MHSVHYSEVLPALLNPLYRRIEQVSADGAYDTRGRYEVIGKKGAKAVTPPRKNAALWDDGHPRNDAVLAQQSDQLGQWKTDSHYNQRTLSETAMYRYKQLLSGKVTLRKYNGQVGEILANVKALNKLTSLGMPVLQRLS